jgi:MFS family permease
VAAAGEGICILINAISYVAVLVCLHGMRLPGRRHTAATADVLRRMVVGFRYAFGFDPIRTILSLVALTSLVAVPFTVLLPVVATTVLGGDARTLGVSMAATGLGALVGALFLASRRSVRGLGRVIVFAAILFGGSLIGVALSRSLAFSVLMLTGARLGMMVHMAASNTVLQTLVDEDKRGRIMSLYSMAYIGVTPLGSLLPARLLRASARLSQLRWEARHALWVRQLSHPVCRTYARRSGPFMNDWELFLRWQRVSRQ